MSENDELDLLHGTIGDKLIRIALPLALTAVLQQLFNAADIAVVGRFVGEGAMAAVGGSAPVIALVVNLFTGLSMGANVVLAQMIGQGDHEGLGKAVHTSILFALFGGLLFAALCECAAAGILPLLSVPAEVRAMTLTYLRIYFLGLPVIFLYNFEAAVFRSRGDTRTPLLVLTVSGAANVLLNLLFVLGFGMAAGGVAAATVLSNLLSAAALFALLCRSRTELRVVPRELRIEPRLLRSILRIGVPAGLQNMVFALANVCVQSAINSLGTTIIAASSAAYNLEILSYYFCSSFAHACTTAVGQNYGAGQPERCRRTLRVTLGLDFLFTAASGALLLLFAAPLLSLFNGDSEVVRYGAYRLRMLIPCYGFSILIDCLSGYLRAFGEAAAPALASLVCACGTRIAWVFLVFPRHRSFEHLMLVYPLTLGATALVITLYWALWQRKQTGGAAHGMAQKKL